MSTTSVNSSSLGKIERLRIPVDDRPLPDTILRLRHTQTSDGQTLVLCTSEAALELEPLQDRKGLIVYSETVALPSNFELANGNLQLFTHWLNASEKSSPAFCEITCNGSAGTPSTENSKPAITGSSGRNISVYIGDLSPFNLAKFGWSSMGGRGGGILTDAELRGADGGSGGSVVLFVQSLLSKAIALARTLMDAQINLAVDKLEAAQIADDRAVTLGTLVDLCRILFPEEHGTRFTELLESLENLLMGPWVIYPVEIERRLIRRLCQMLSAKSDTERFRILESINVSGGHGGLSFNSRQKNGQRGSSGKAEVYYNYLVPATTRRVPLAFAHPDQCSMVLEVAKLYYFQGTSDSLAKSHDLFTRLQTRLMFVDSVQDGDALHHAYKNAEPTMHLLKRSQTNPTELQSLVQLKELRSQACGFLKQLGMQVDFYGHPPGYVPRANFDFYHDLSEKLLVHLKAAQDIRMAYTNADATSKERTTKVLEMQKVLVNSQKGGSEEAQQLEAFIRAQIKLATSLIQSSTEAQEKLSKALEGMAQEVAQLKPSLGIDFMDLIEAGSMICFAPNPAMILLQVAGLAYRAEHDKGIKTEDGSLVKQDLLVDQVNSVKGDVASILKASSDVKRAGSRFSLDDPKATKLIVAKSAFMGTIKDIRKALAKDHFKNLDDAFQRYIDLITERNTVILQYNAAVHLLWQREEKIASLKARCDSIELLGTDLDADLPAIAIFMEQSYFEILHYTMKIFYLTQKAFQFWAVSKKNFIGEKLSGNVVSNISYESMYNLRVDILQQLQGAVEGQVRDPGYFNRFKYALRDEDLKNLCNSPEKGIYLRIPTTSSGLDINGPDFPFTHMHRVRLKVARFFLAGATSKNDLIRVNLTHMGQETITTDDGHDIDFQHEAIPVIFQYHASRAPDFDPDAEGTMDADIGKATGSKYALVGPFTTWHISISGSNDHATVGMGENYTVDLSKVTEGYFHFSGWASPKTDASS